MHCGKRGPGASATFEMLEPRLLLSGAPTLFDLSPALFVANEGQWADDAVRYAYLRDGANVLFTDAGPVFQVFGDDAYAEVAVTFDGSNSTRAEGRDVSDAVFNYYVGPDASGWREGVSAYETVAYAGLYDGIDLVTWGRRGGLKYEFHVAPWTDYRQVRISYDGVESLSIDGAGRLHAVTSAGALVEAAPVIYQERSGVRVEVPGRFRLLDADTVTFVLTGAYDPTVELVIDPDLEWSSYLGGSSDDVARDVTCDGAGNLLVTGQTNGGGFPTTGGFDTTYAGATDAFVTKVSTEGDLLWSSYLGGAAWEAGMGIDTNAAGNVFVTGQTLSGDFPTTGGFDTSLGGGADAFVTKIRGDGGAVLWSSYLGGGSTDGGEALSVTSTGDVYVVGTTFSTNFNTTGGLYPTYNDLCDAFVAKITGAGTYVWGTYLGSADYDHAYDVAVDSQDNAIVTGLTSANGFPAGNGGPSTWMGGYDVFVVKLTGNCGWVWGNLLGNTNDEEGHGVAVDAADNIFVTGWTQSSNYPTTPGAFDTTLSAQEAFVTRLTPGGAIVWSTLLGGDANDVARGVAIDAEGDVVVVGETLSDNFDTTDGFDTTNTSEDAFVTVFTNSGSLLWSSYLGGSGDDYAYGVDTNAASAIYIAGKTESGNFPADDGFDTSLGGTMDAFATKVEALTEPYYARHPLLFARDCYTGFLRRAADAGGAAWFADQIEHYGMEYRECAAFFLTSGEFETWVAPIVRLYRAYLDRTPDATGLNVWVNAVKAGVPMTALTYAFAHSAEFIALHGDVYNTTTNAQFVTWLYNAVLKRTPAPAEVAAWQTALDNVWMTREAMMVAFSQSAEYAAAQNNVVHCTMALLGLLGRPGTDYEIGLLATAVGGGASLSDVCGFVMETHEYQAHIVQTDLAIPGPVVRLYEGLLDRTPDYTGLVSWADAFIEGYPLTAVAYGFITSAEVTGTYGDVYYGYTNAQYVTWLYNRVLGRDPAPAEVAAWQPALDGGYMTREQMALAFTESPEYQTATQSTVTVSSVFPMLLGRMSDRAERSYWETVLDAGVTSDNMIVSMVVL